MKRGRCVSEEHRHEEGLSMQMCVLAQTTLSVCVCWVKRVLMGGSGLYLCSVGKCVCACLILLEPLPRYQIKVVNMLPKLGAKRQKILMAKDLYSHTHTHSHNRGNGDICSTILFSFLAECSTLFCFKIVPQSPRPNVNDKVHSFS